MTPVFYWLVARFVRYLFLPLYTRIKVQGIENVPRSWPLVIAANHLNDGDPLIIASRLPRRAVFMAKEELFRVPILGPLVRLFGAFPVRRNQADLASLRKSGEVLSQGLALVIFPEGRTTTKEARMSEAHPGAAMVALRHHATVLPVAITGSERLQLPWFFLRVGRRYDVTMTFGEPLVLPRPSRLNNESAGEATDEIMRRIAALLPESYRGYYGIEPVTGNGAGAEG